MLGSTTSNVQNSNTNILPIIKEKNINEMLQRKKKPFEIPAIDHNKQR